MNILVFLFLSNPELLLYCCALDHRFYLLNWVLECVNYVLYDLKILNPDFCKSNNKQFFSH